MRIVPVLLLACVLTSIPVSAAEPPPWKDPGCETEKVDLKLDPAALLAEFLKRDAAGEFVESSAWLTKAVVCPGQLGGPDSSTVVLGSKIASSKVSGSTASFQVTYEVAGTLTSGGPDGTQNVFLPERKSLTQAFTALKTPWGWKLQETSWPNISPAAVQTKFGSRPWATGEQKKFEAATKAR